MKTIIRLIDFLKECVDTDHKRRGMVCLVCSTIVVVVLLVGIFYTINNFINKPINTNLQIERQK